MSDLLGGINDILSLADNAWTYYPANLASGANLGNSSDILWGKIAVKGRETYKLRNQSNETIRLTCYYCVARRDWKFDYTTQDLNIYKILATGFAENGLTVNGVNADSVNMQDDRHTPFQSHAFCRQYKITRVKNIVIAPGAIVARKIRYPWRVHTPAHYTTNPGSETGSSWSGRGRNVNSLKGERFILFKLHGNIGGIAGQTVLEKDIGQTTPTVIMETSRMYWFKHLPISRSPAIDFTTSGHQATTASIIVDDDEKKGAEIDAS